MRVLQKKSENIKSVRKSAFTVMSILFLSLVLTISTKAAVFDTVTGQPNLPADAKLLSGYSGSVGNGTWQIYTSSSSLLYGSYMVVDVNGAIPDYKRPSSGCGGYAPWYAYCVDQGRAWHYLYKAIIFRGNITKIGQSTFCEQYDLRCPVIIPESVTEIGASAFAVCDKISYIQIPDSVTVIGEYAIHNTVPIKCSLNSAAYQYAKKNKNKIILTDLGEVSLSQTQMTLKVGQEQTLNVNCKISDVDKSYGSNNTRVATVTSDGVIKAISSGEATITVKVNEEYYTCKVTVSSAANTTQTGNEAGNNGGQSTGSKSNITTTSSETTRLVPTVKLKKKNNKKYTVTIGSAKGATGYQIQYATNKKFTAAKLKNVSKSKLTVTLSGKKGKTYYVRVRAKKGTIMGSPVVGKWSKVKKLTLK